MRTALRSLGLPFIINEEALHTVKQEAADLEEEAKTSGGLDLKMLEVSLEERYRLVEWMKIFEAFAKEEEMFLLRPRVKEKNSFSYNIPEKELRRELKLMD